MSEQSQAAFSTASTETPTPAGTQTPKASSALTAGERKTMNMAIFDALTATKSKKLYTEFTAGRKGAYPYNGSGDSKE